MSAGSGAPCVHCGLATRARRLDGGPGPFCCIGCELAHHLSGRGAEDEGADRLLARILVCAFLATGVMVFSLAGYGRHLPGADAAQGASEAARALTGLHRLAALLLTLPIVHLLGVPLAAAVHRGRRWLSADGWIALGAGSALALSLWSTATGKGEVYYETVAMVLVLVGLGRWLDARARERARAHLADLAEVTVPPARRIDGGTESTVPPDALAPGDRVRVRPGEPIPVDGVVTAGRSLLDAALLTGESEPRPVSAGDRVLAGAVPVDGFLDVRAEAVAGSRLRDAVERLLADALERRGRHVAIADRLAGVLVPLVGVGALATFAVHGRLAGAEAGLMNALSLVLISCPCALGIATPLAFWTALSTAWRRGVLVRGADVLERLARARRVELDKTGTLTDPRLDLVRVETLGAVGADEVLARAAALEGGSEHPVAAAVRRAWTGDGRGHRGPDPELTDFRVLPGRGVSGRLDGRPHVLERVEHRDGPHTVVELRGGGQPLARFGLAAPLDPEAPRAVRSLRLAGLELRVLTGDSEGPARRVAEALGLPVEHGLLPDEKVARVREHAGGARTIVVGDGLNDAAALAAASVGIAVAGASPRSVGVADVVLLGRGVGAVPELVRLARRAVSTARGNLAWAVGYNALGWSLAATGRLTPVFAAAAMVLSSVGVVLHSTRAARIDPGQRSTRGASPAAGGSSAPALPSPG